MNGTSPISHAHYLRIEKAGIEEWNRDAFTWLKTVLDETSRLGSVTAMFSDGDLEWPD